MLLDVSSFGLDGATMSTRLFEYGVCATAMVGWGDRHGPQYVRFVFANESVECLKTLGARVRAALDVKRSAMFGSPQKIAGQPSHPAT